MATFTATIQLYEVTEQDYKNLFSKLEKHDLKNKCHLVMSRQFVDGKSEYKWSGNVSIQEITSSILRSVSGMGLNYSFTITRRKVAG